MDTKIVTAKAVFRLAKEIQSDSDYVYDPEHKNRPHGGGTWYRTPRGWTTNKQDLESRKEDDLEKNLNVNQSSNMVHLLPPYHPVDHIEFHNAIKAAKESNPPEKRWRVDVHDADDHKNCKTFMTDSGSTVAIKEDGDIISVCKKAGTSDRGSDLLKIATANKGVKLDSFDGNHDFYTRNGFKPVSWTKFDENYAPEGWVKGRDATERIIFYRYIGKPYTEMSLEEFCDSVESQDYDTAAKIRDEEIENETK